MTNTKTTLMKTKIFQNPIIVIVGLPLISYLVTFILGLVGLPKVYRIAIFFGLVNFVLAFKIGQLIIKNKLSKWLIFLMPVTFAVVVLLYYAKYNLFFAGIYLIITLMGMAAQRQQIYR